MSFAVVAQTGSLGLPFKHFATPGPSSTAAPATREASLDLSGVIERFDLGQTLADTPLESWLTLLAAIFAGLLIGKAVQALLRALARQFNARDAKVRATICQDAASPASLALFTAGLSVGLSALMLSPALWDLSARMVEFLWVIALGWYAFNLVDLIDHALRHFTAKTATRLDDQVVPLVRKTLRIFLVVVFGLFVAENIFGADITAWLAGFGLAGLAVSLAAQDSIKNLFGSVAIFLDRPFNIGDRVVFTGYDGMIEEIGFRSTKLRTLTGHLVNIPNSKVCANTVENVQRRTSIRRLTDLSLPLDTPPEKVEQAVQIIRDLLADPEIAPGFGDMVNFPPRCGFSEISAAGLNVRFVYWFYPNDYWLYLEHAQRFNLKLLRAFNEQGIDFAYPTQTLYLARDEKRGFTMRIADEPAPGVGGEAAAVA